jgi:histone chaperone ASF1
VGPIPVGVNKFQFKADPPEPKSIPASDILGVTVILLTCAYDDKEFIRVGYYQNNEYPEGSEERRVWEEKLESKEKITTVDIPKVVRNILADKPKVTRFNIKWYDTLRVKFNGRDNPGEDVEYPPPQPLDGEIDRMMETDEAAAFIAHDIAPKHEATSALVENGNGVAPVEGEDIEEIGSEDDDEEEDDEAEISLDEEELDEEEGEGEPDEDEEMADAADEDVTMGSVDHPLPTAHVAQAT